MKTAKEISSVRIRRIVLEMAKRANVGHIRLSGSASVPMEWQHSFESDVEILGNVEDLYSVATPAGIFEDCLNIQYEAKPPSVKTKEFTDLREGPELQKRKFRKHMEVEIQKELTTLLTHVIPKLGLESVWLAPGVGPVNIKSAEGTAVLIDYEVKAEDLYRSTE